MNASDRRSCAELATEEDVAHALATQLACEFLTQRLVAGPEAISMVPASLALTLVIAQRLVRRICRHRSQPTTPTDEHRAALRPSRRDIEDTLFRLGTRCGHCADTGVPPRSTRSRASPRVMCRPTAPARPAGRS